MEADKKPEAAWWKIDLDEELERHSQLKREDLVALSGWLAKQPHLPPLPDHLLAVFLCSCSFSIEQAKEAIDINYTIRTRLPKVFKNRNTTSPAAQIVREYLQIGLIPHRTDQPAVIVGGFRPMDVSKFNLDEFYLTCYMFQDITHLLLGLVPHGYHFIYDLTNFHLGHMLRMPLSLTAEIMKYNQEGSCCKIKGVHIIHGGQIIEKLLTFLKPFMGLQLRKAIQVHNKPEELMKALGAANVPSDWGGDAPSFQHLTEKAYRLLEEYTPWLELEENWRVDEARRPPENKVGDGLTGSFRTLQLD